MAIVRDLEKRYGRIAIYVVGTSRSTDATMALARSLDGQVAGFVHTSSMSGISSFDPRGMKSRNLIVLHVRDACRVTSPSAGVASHNKFGTELIQMDGGKSTGDDCEAYAYHGYNGIEQRTVEWIRLDKPVDPLTYDAQATALVSSYLEARFGREKLVVADRGKFRDNAGRLIYAFAAKGLVNQWPAYWQGVVIFFDTGVAFPSELLAQDSQHKFAPLNGIILQSTVNWAMTIRPGT